MRNSAREGFNCQDCTDCRHYIYYGMFTCVWSGMDPTIKDHESCRLNMDMEQVKEEGVCNGYSPWHY